MSTLEIGFKILKSRKLKDGSRLIEKADLIDISWVPDEEDRNKALAKMLLQLLREHKKNCHKSDCGISVYYFLTLWERLSGRKPTKKEFKVFL